MLKTKITVLFVGVVLSSQALAIDPPHILEDRFGPHLASWGDSFPGPQPLIPPVKLIMASGGQGIYVPPIGPQPNIPPSGYTLASGTTGGFLPPSGPMPYPPSEELPMILASVDDIDDQLEGFPITVEISLRDLGQIIDSLYRLEGFIKDNPEVEGVVPPQEMLDDIAGVIRTANELGYIEDSTSEELLGFMFSWHDQP